MEDNLQDIPQINIADLPQENKIRSIFIAFEGPGPHEFNADVLKPYSFCLVNTGAADIVKDGMVIVKGSNQNDQNKLNFPGIVAYKRNDILKFTMPGAGTKTAFIRADLELVF